MPTSSSGPTTVTLMPGAQREEEQKPLEWNNMSPHADGKQVLLMAQYLYATSLGQP